MRVTFLIRIDRGDGINQVETNREHFSKFSINSVSDILERVRSKINGNFFFFFLRKIGKNLRLIDPNEIAKDFSNRMKYEINNISYLNSNFTILPLLELDSIATSFFVRNE